MATILLLLCLLTVLLVLTDAQSVVVCYGGAGDGLPSQQEVVSLYKINNITRMRIYNPDQAILQALKGTNIELIIGVPNDALQSLNQQSAANTWVRNNIQKYTDVRFRYVAVGNEVDPNNGNSEYVSFLLPAMQNVHNAITAAGLANQIKVSTTTYAGLLGVSYPPSTGAFRDNVLEFIEPIIRFLAENNSPMLVNIYPYFAYANSEANSNLPYALFTAPRTIVRDNSRNYSNLFDAILDAHYAAQASLGGGNVKIVVSESGWPSAGGDAATIQNAGTYYENLIARVTGTTGTPAKPGRSIETYLFSMFDERNKPGAESEKHFGIFSPDQRPKYQLGFNAPKSRNGKISERYGLLAAFSLMMCGKPFVKEIDVTTSDASTIDYILPMNTVIVWKPKGVFFTKRVNPASSIFKV